MKYSFGVGHLVWCVFGILGIAVAGCKGKNEAASKGSLQSTMSDTNVAISIQHWFLEATLASFEQGLKQAGADVRKADILASMPKRNVRVIRKTSLGEQRHRVLCLLGTPDGKRHYIPVAFELSFENEKVSNISVAKSYERIIVAGPRYNETGLEFSRRQLHEVIEHWTKLEGKALEVAAERRRRWADEMVEACLFAEQEELPLIGGVGDHARWQSMAEKVASQTPKELKSFVLVESRKSLALIGAQ